MVHIVRPSKPEELTDEVQKQLIEEYKLDNKKAVWSKDYIKNALLEMSNHKCAYCECLVGKGTVDMHIDHFKPKSLYPDLVVDWDNLLPSCPDCNRAKSNTDTAKESIVNPTRDNPKEHFYISNYRYKSIQSSSSSRANRTIDILQLNDTDKKVMKRFVVGEALQDKISEFARLASEHELDIAVNTRVRNRIRKGCCDILKFGVASSEYSAFMSTIIQKDSDYTEIQRILKSKNIWDDELEELDKATIENAYVNAQL